MAVILKRFSEIAKTHASRHGGFYKMMFSVSDIIGFRKVEFLNLSDIYQNTDQQWR